MDNQQERLVWLSHLAGLIEGEGWFGLTVIRRPKKLSIVPRFAMQMNDKTIIAWAASVLQRLELAHHVTKDGDRIEVVGVKRLSRFLSVVLPHLLGHKRTVAEIQKAWIEYRLTQPFHFVNYTEKDLEFVNRLRSLNAGNGKDKMIPASILRDYTSQTRPKQRASQDIVHAPPKVGDATSASGGRSVSPEP